jgi:hypothetical protein
MSAYVYIAVDPFFVLEAHVSETVISMSGSVDTGSRAACHIAEDCVSGCDSNNSGSFRFSSLSMSSIIYHWNIASSMMHDVIVESCDGFTPIGAEL